MGKKVLVIDENKSFGHILNYILKGLIKDIDFALEHDKVSEMLNSNCYDIIILIYRQNKGNTLSLCKSLRSKTNMPIIVISEIEEKMKKILFLECGVDEYFIMPLDPLEVKLRIKNLCRRYIASNQAQSGKVRKNEFIIDTFRKKIYTKNGKDLNLTSKEFDLFFLFLYNPKKIFTRDELMEKVWDYSNYGVSRTVDVHVRKIRRKLKKETNREYIVTKWGKGYYFQP